MSTFARAPARDMVRVALFAALIAALGLVPPVPVPVIPVPITAQTLGVMLAGAILGPRLGALAVALVLLCVGIGLPLLAGGRGGLGVFAGPGGGFLLGWVAGAWVVGMIAGLRRDAAMPWLLVSCLAGGIGAIYLVGVPWMSAVGDLTLTQAAAASAAFLPGDIVKAAIAAAVARGVRRGYPMSGA
ncbi:MAG: biotin transporter BioY [Rhodospirillaceae bacterium]|nr:biotin transporter BioY [Rhodospirillaceae bacterium]